MFLTDYGEAFGADWLGEYIKRYIQSAGVLVPGACHLFRHACATHMLENGADIRYIQVLLGHASLTSTQLYTNVSIQKLKAIHTATHPARWKRSAGDESGAAKGRPHRKGAAAATAFLDALAREDDDV